jgi:anti-sigma regulatory factor (Ser/Thr protein kinase)
VAVQQTPHLELVVPAVAGELGGLRDATRSFAARHGVAHPERAALAVSEACANAILQARGMDPPGDLRLMCDRYADRVVFVVEGNGRGFAPRPDGELALPMMAQMADRVLIGDGNGDGNHGGLHTELTFALGS